MPVWSAPVRYAEIDGQGIVFNAHYLTYCDEAMAAFARAEGLTQFAELVRLKTSTITWTGSARWGDTVEVEVEVVTVGRTSVTFRFSISASGRSCCTVTTVYVYADTSGVPQPVPDDVRSRLPQRPAHPAPAMQPDDGTAGKITAEGFPTGRGR